jgi:pilus assembly protein CpaD
MQTIRTTIEGRRLAEVALTHRMGAKIMWRAAFVVGCAVFLGACNTDQQVAGVPSVPPDYRMRHPISIKEADRTLELFMGSNRGALTPSQRADILSFAQRWRREASGGVIVELPAGSTNARAAADALPEIRSILAASGVPPQGIVVRNYPGDARTFATVRIIYPAIVAQAGPCGLWPKDIGPSANREYFENQPYWNLGCSSQQNLAAMVDNPADLVQPRGETPNYMPRRTVVVEKYRAGAATVTTYSNASATEGRITDIGQ